MDGLALSALDWWEEAGVDTFVDELPRDWLAHPAATQKASETGTESAPAPATTPLPDDLATFQNWLLSDTSVPGRAAVRLATVGDPASGTMILIDMPEAEDRTARTLLSGEPGALFDRMLGAMGLSRDAAYLVPFSPARPASGSLDASAIAALAPLARHHLALAAPKRLLLMGDAPTRALLALGSNEARGRPHSIRIAGNAVPTIATFAPRFILQASAPDEIKARRAKVWADLQLFMAL